MEFFARARELVNRPKRVFSLRRCEIPRTHDLEELQRQCLQEEEMEGLSDVDLPN